MMSKDMDPLIISSRKTTLARMDDSFDREFWENVSPSRRVELVWDLSLQAWELAGKELPGEEGRPRSIARVHRP
jgi:hypothetical protein